MNPIETRALYSIRRWLLAAKTQSTALAIQARVILCRYDKVCDDDCPAIWLLAAGLSMEEIGHLFVVKKSTINSWITGKYNPRPLIPQIAMAYAFGGEPVRKAIEKALKVRVTHSEVTRWIDKAIAMGYYPNREAFCVSKSMRSETLSRWENDNYEPSSYWSAFEVVEYAFENRLVQRQAFPLDWEEVESFLRRAMINIKDKELLLVFRKAKKELRAYGQNKETYLPSVRDLGGDKVFTHLFATCKTVLDKWKSDRSLIPSNVRLVSKMFFSLPEETQDAILAGPAISHWSKEEFNAALKKYGIKQSELMVIFGLTTNQTISNWARGVTKKVPAYVHTFFELLDMGAEVPKK